MGTTEPAALRSFVPMAQEVDHSAIVHVFPQDDDCFWPPYSTGGVPVFEGNFLYTSVWGVLPQVLECLQALIMWHRLSGWAEAEV